MPEHLTGDRASLGAHLTGDEGTVRPQSTFSPSPTLIAKMRTEPRSRRKTARRTICQLSIPLSMRTQGKSLSKPLIHGGCERSRHSLGRESRRTGLNYITSSSEVACTCTRSKPQRDCDQVGWKCECKNQRHYSSASYMSSPINFHTLLRNAQGHQSPWNRD